MLVLYWKRKDQQVRLRGVDPQMKVDVFHWNVHFFIHNFLTVNKSKDSPVDAAKKKAELEKRLQDVSGQLSGTKSSKSSKKNAGEFV